MRELGSGRGRRVHRRARRSGSGARASRLPPLAEIPVRAKLDERAFPKGVEVTDEELAEVNLIKDAFHGEWNYTIVPSTSRVVIRLFPIGSLATERRDLVRCRAGSRTTSDELE